MRVLLPASTSSSPLSPTVLKLNELARNTRKLTSLKAEQARKGKTKDMSRQSILEDEIDAAVDDEEVSNSHGEGDNPREQVILDPRLYEVANNLEDSVFGSSEDSPEYIRYPFDDDEDEEEEGFFEFDDFSDVSEDDQAIVERYFGSDATRTKKSAAAADSSEDLAGKCGQLQEQPL